MPSCMPESAQLLVGVSDDRCAPLCRVAVCGVVGCELWLIVSASCGKSTRLSSNALIAQTGKVGCANALRFVRSCF